MVPCPSNGSIYIQPYSRSRWDDPEPALHIAGMPTTGRWHLLLICRSRRTWWKNWREFPLHRRILVAPVLSDNARKGQTSPPTEAQYPTRTLVHFMLTILLCWPILTNGSVKSLGPMLGLCRIVHSCLVLDILILDVDLTLKWNKKPSTSTYR